MELPKNYSIWLAVDYNGIEKAFWNKPKRCEKHREWWGDKMVLPKGSIKKLIGRELSWSDEPVELKENQINKNMNDYLKMSIEDLERLKEDLLSQRDNLEDTIGEIISNIKSKKTQINDNYLRLNPYYEDKVSCLKIVVNDVSGYIVTKVTPNDKWMGIYQFYTETIDFLKYYKVCSKSEWENAIDRLNIYFKDASLEVKEL